jgi:sugar phosphate isomerase/epimerase
MRPEYSRDEWLANRDARRYQGAERIDSGREIARAEKRGAILMITRRNAIAALGTSLIAGAAHAQNPPAPGEEAKPKFGYSAPPRATPLLCVFSGNLARVPYAQLGEIAGQIGFEGVDITVMIGGHVDPRVTSVDLVRAFESVRGANLEVPMITTSITTAAEPTAFPVLYLTGKSQVPLFRLGAWTYGEATNGQAMDIRQRLALVRRDLTQLIPLEQRSEICALFPNRAGAYVGESTWDAQSIIEGIDPRWVGHMFDPAEATAEGGAGGWEAALRVALPRLKAVGLQDFYWEKQGDAWAMHKCPLGEGMVDFGKFFSILSAAHFNGPISIAMEYKPKDAPGAMSKDLAFTRKHVEQAWADARPRRTGT